MTSMGVFMRVLFRSAACAAIFTFVGAASAVDFQQSGAFTTAPGYGWEVLGTFSSTIDNYNFQYSVVDTLAIKTDPSSQVTGLDGKIGAKIILLPDSSQFTAVQSYSMDVQLTVRFIDLATQSPAVPPYLFSDAKLFSAWWAVSRTTGISVVQPEKVELRFSNPLVTSSASILDQSGTTGPNATAFGGSCNELTACHIPSPQYTYLGHFEFIPGNYLSASDDPNCASFACMKPGKDALSLAPIEMSFEIVRQVPEPATQALLLGGLGIVAYWRRRQQRSEL